MKVAVPVLSALVAALIVYLVQEQRIDSLKKQITNAPASSRPQSQKRSGVPLRKTTSKTARTGSSSQPRKISSKEKGGSKSMTSVLQSVEGRALVKNGIKAGIPGLYGTFITQMELSAEEEKFFTGLLIERLLNQQQHGLKWIESDPEERTEIEATMQKELDESTATIEQFLQNSDDFLAFKKYEEQIPERQQFNRVGNPFSNEPLPAGVEDQVIDLLYDARLTSGEGSGSEEENWRALATGTDFSQIEARWQATDQEIARKLPNLLTPTQTETFLKHWQSARAQKVAEYQMGLTMLGLTKE